MQALLRIPLVRLWPWTWRGAAIADWAEAERGRFVLFLPVLMAAGVVLYAAQRAEPPWWVAPGVLALSGALAWRSRRWQLARALCLSVAAVALGMAAIGLAAWRAPALLDLPHTATILGGLVGGVEQLPNGRRLTLVQATLDAGPEQPRRLRVRLRKDDETLVSAGDRVQIRALLRSPGPPAYPGAWDLQRDAFFNGLGGSGFALGRLEILARAAPRGPALWLQYIREAIAGRIRAILPGSDGAIAATLLTGSAAAIPPADRAAFRDSGLAHLLAIAGLHIGIVMGLIFAGVRFGLAWSERATLYWPLKTIAGVAALAVGLVYLLLTGAHLPILRSFAMAGLVTIGLLAGRRTVSLRGLALAMALLVLFVPAEVLGVSFQMSFSAVLALIVGYDLLRPWLIRLHGDGGRGRRVLGHIVALALTSALAGTASAFYGAYHFGHIQLYFVVANMVAVPLAALWVMPAGLIALALMPLHLEVLALTPMGWGVQAILFVARGVAAWPAAVLAVPHIPPFGLVAYSVGLAWLGLWRTRVRLAGLAAILLSLISPMLVRPPDILVSNDAGLIALRTPEGIELRKSAGASRFVLEAWLQYWASTATTPLPACGPAGCTLPDAWVRLVDDRTAQAACAARLLISAAPIKLHCGPGVATIDRFTVWRDGAMAVWRDPDGLRVLSDRDYRGDRPWVAPIPTRGRLPPGAKLRVAPVDE